MRHWFIRNEISGQATDFTGELSYRLNPLRPNALNLPRVLCPECPTCALARMGEENEIFGLRAPSGSGYTQGDDNIYLRVWGEIQLHDRAAAIASQLRAALQIPNGLQARCVPRPLHSPRLLKPVE